MFYPDQVRILVCGQHVDMRKSFEGLQAIAKQVLEEDPLNGAVFVFINRRGNYLKALYWDRSGWCIWSKRLEQGQFHLPARSVLKQEISFSQFKLLLDGLEIEIKRQYKRFSYPPALQNKSNRL